MAKGKKRKSVGDLVTFTLTAAAFLAVGLLLSSGSLTRQVSNMLLPISV